MQTIVLLYNERDRRTVEAIGDVLDRRWSDTPLQTWIAYRDFTAFGDIFDQIEEAIERAAGVVVFIGQHGLGRFQRNIELGAVNTQRWQQGAAYGTLLVHLAADVQVPHPLLRWPTFNHDGANSSVEELATGISQRFGVAPAVGGRP